MICEYGCGQKANHQFKNGKWCCEKSCNKCPGLRKVNSESNRGRKLNNFESINNPNNNLCENGCGQIAKYISREGKLYCNDNHRKCLINRRVNSKSQIGKKIPKGENSKLFGRKRPDHSLFIKNNNPMNDKDVKIKHKYICSSKEYKDNMSKIIKDRWLSEEYRKMYSESLIKKGLKRTDEEIGKRNAYYRKVLTITKQSVENINPDNLPIGIGDGFYNVDHIFSIAEGFRRNIKPEIIGNKANLQILPWKDNIMKRDKCWITQKELEEKYNANNI